jgi:hypothetical protein
MSIDRFLKLKLDLVYRDLPVEQAQQHFNVLKQPIEQVEEEVILPKPAVKRRKRIPGKK